jgi:hypothetical protein
VHEYDPGAGFHHLFGQGLPAIFLAAKEIGEMDEASLAG